MKFQLISLSLLSISALSLTPSLTAPASAACAMTDVGVQVSVHGSHDPTRQINNSTMESGEHCLGSTATNVGTQVYVGSGPVEQVRNSYEYVGGDASAYPGFNTPVIGVPVGVPVDVYAPAYDPSFYGNLPFAGSNFYPGYGTN
jgi:hypothetical protein